MQRGRGEDRVREVGFFSYIKNERFVRLMCYVVISGKFATKHKKYYCIKCHQNILNLVGNKKIKKMTTSITIAAFQ